MPLVAFDHVGMAMDIFEHGVEDEELRLLRLFDVDVWLDDVYDFQTRALVVWFLFIDRWGLKWRFEKEIK